MITYDEFFECVKKELAWELTGFKLTDKQLIEYMHKEEKTIKSRYNMEAEAYKNGKINDIIFSGSCASSVAECLGLMYE